MYYIRATNNNRFGDGTYRWLRIRKIIKKDDGYELTVKIRNIFKQIFISEKYHKYVEFGEGWPDLKPIDFNALIYNLNNKLEDNNV